jgi:hypothetical protein
MGLLSKLGDFLFGKTPDIFAEDGSVRHKLPKEKWEAWQNRYLMDPEYNWKNHIGTKAKAHKPVATP